jgi:putative glutamine amidotransferase
MFENKTKPIVGIAPCMDAGRRINPERTYQYIEISYALAVAEAGALPILIPYFEDTALYDDLLDGIDGIVISGGEDLPSNVPGEETPPVPLALTPECRLAQDRALLDGMLARTMPFLGICYGAQILNLHLGGTLYYDIPHQIEGADIHRPDDAAYRHRVRIIDATRLGGILGAERLSVNSSHHQAIRDVGRGLKVAAVCDDGVIEAIETWGDGFVIGVQWHPEKIDDENRRKLFSAFIDACRLHASSRGTQGDTGYQPHG